MAASIQYRKILLATDGSALAEAALHHAVALARLASAELTILYVVDAHLAFMTGILRQAALDELRADGQRALDAAGEVARGADLNHHVCRSEGRPGEAFIAEAERLGAYLIVVGSHGQSALTDILLGSVSQYVLHHARVPVCIVPSPR
jgi:nucleotide-binding universal stress UspA family protein